MVAAVERDDSATVAEPEAERETGTEVGGVIEDRSESVYGTGTTEG